MSAPTCRDLAADLVAYLDGDLEPQQLRDVEQHVSSCRTCRTCADELMSTIRLIRREAFRPMDAETRQRVKSRLWETIHREQDSDPQSR